MACPIIPRDKIKIYRNKRACIVTKGFRFLLSKPTHRQLVLIASV